MRLASRHLYWLLIISCACSEDFWKDLKDQVKNMTCIQPEECTNCVLKKTGAINQVQKLGKVINIQVCAELCCEVETCDIALLEDDRCYSITCESVDSCETTKAPEGSKSNLVKFHRKQGTDIWNVGSRSPQEGQSKIVTKQAAMQKSKIIDIYAKKQEKKGSFIAVSNKEKVDSPMDVLLKKESSIVQSKQNKKPKKEESGTKKEGIAGRIAVGEKIQDVTEHYMKSPEKVDMTALQENETLTNHAAKPIASVHGQRRDLRHTLISPITIGAFTCMAVIAVSGFAMAIIKYQKERKEFEDKQTQKP